jgi:hypothetical protein
MKHYRTGPAGATNILQHLEMLDRKARTLAGNAQNQQRTATSRKKTTV